MPVKSKPKPKTKAKPKPKPKSKPKAKPKPKSKSKPKSSKVVLLSGGNPQIPKGDGKAPVMAYIAASPGWKKGFGKRLDALVEQVVPEVARAVRWNSPFYGVPGNGYFLSTHIFAKYVKLTFFRGRSLDPIPPGGTEKSKDVRWLDVYEDDELDEAQLVRWIEQAAALPGWDLAGA